MEGSSPRSGSPGRLLQNTSNNFGLSVTTPGPSNIRSRLDVSDSQADESSALEDTAVLSNGSSEHMASVDEPESLSDKHRAAIQQIRCKILSTKDKIKEEQTARDDNVNEYLRLAANADKQQIQRIKSVFEKKNQKSAQIIAQLQKKLEIYNKRIRSLEAQRGSSSASRQPREVLRGMGHGLKHVGGNIRDGISGFSGGVVENIKGGLHGAAETVMSKPREIAHYLIKNRFGSADNINTLTRLEGGRDVGRDGSEDGGVDRGNRHGSATLPNNCTLSSNKFPSDDGSPCSSVTSESGAGGGSGGGVGGRTGIRRDIVLDAQSLDMICRELQDRREEIELLKEKLETCKELQKEVQALHQQVQEEKFRSERLEEQINDLTELHQNEVENLKQTITDMEEKVQYQSEERLRDIHEILEACQTKISKMEHQQLQHQQYVTLEGLDNGNARALIVKSINVVLTVLQVVLLLVATVAGIIMPFFKTRLRFVSTLAVITSLVFVLKQWPELTDFGANLLRHFNQALSLSDK